MELEASEHVSLAVVTTTATLEFEEQGDHSVNFDGCDEESAVSIMSFSRVLKAA